MTWLSNRRNRRGYSIADLFLLTAAIAVVVAFSAWTFRNRGRVSTEVAIVNGIVGLVGGALLGGCLGGSFRRRAHAFLLGTGVGGAVGALAGVVTAVPMNMPMAAVSSALLIFVGLGLLILMRPDEKPPEP